MNWVTVTNALLILGSSTHLQGYSPASAVRVGGYKRLELIPHMVPEHAYINSSVAALPCCHCFMATH